MIVEIEEISNRGSEMLKLRDGSPVIVTINHRRYTICDEIIAGTSARCGALIDVTDSNVIRATDDCGKSHRREDSAILGVD